MLLNLVGCSVLFEEVVWGWRKWCSAMKSGNNIIYIISYINYTFVYIIIIINYIFIYININYTVTQYYFYYYYSQSSSSLPQIYACLIIFFICNAVESTLISTGAFEITFNSGWWQRGFGVWLSWLGLCGCEGLGFFLCICVLLLVVFVCVGWVCVDDGKLFFVVGFFG